MTQIIILLYNISFIIIIIIIKIIINHLPQKTGIRKDHVWVSVSGHLGLSMLPGRVSQAET